MPLAEIVPIVSLASRRSATPALLLKVTVAASGMAFPPERASVPKLTVDAPV